jgi:hypothetical protein
MEIWRQKDVKSQRFANRSGQGSHLPVMEYSDQDGNLPSYKSPPGLSKGYQASMTGHAQKLSIINDAMKIKLTSTGLYRLKS